VEEEESDDEAHLLDDNSEVHFGIYGMNCTVVMKDISMSDFSNLTRGVFMNAASKTMIVRHFTLCF
jgi:hypothetical protein